MSTERPHVGSATVDSRRDLGQLVADNLVSWSGTGMPLAPVPKTPVPGRTDGRAATG